MELIAVQHTLKGKLSAISSDFNGSIVMSNNNTSFLQRIRSQRGSSQGGSTSSSQASQSKIYEVDLFTSTRNANVSLFPKLKQASRFEPTNGVRDEDHKSSTATSSGKRKRISFDTSGQSNSQRSESSPFSTFSGKRSAAVTKSELHEAESKTSTRNESTLLYSAVPNTPDESNTSLMFQLILRQCNNILTYQYPPATSVEVPPSSTHHSNALSNTHTTRVVTSQTPATTTPSAALTGDDLNQLEAPGAHHLAQHHIDLFLPRLEPLRGHAFKRPLDLSLSHLVPGPLSHLIYLLRWFQAPPQGIGNQPPSEIHPVSASTSQHMLFNAADNGSSNQKHAGIHPTTTTAELYDILSNLMHSKRVFFLTKSARYRYLSRRFIELHPPSSKERIVKYAKPLRLVPFTIATRDIAPGSTVTPPAFLGDGSAHDLSIFTPIVPSSTPILRHITHCAVSLHEQDMRHVNSRGNGQAYQQTLPPGAAMNARDHPSTAVRDKYSYQYPPTLLYVLLEPVIAYYCPVLLLLFSRLKISLLLEILGLPSQPSGSMQPAALPSDLIAYGRALRVLEQSSAIHSNKHTLSKNGQQQQEQLPQESSGLPSEMDGFPILQTTLPSALPRPQAQPLIDDLPVVVPLLTLFEPGELPLFLSEMAENGHTSLPSSPEYTPSPLRASRIECAMAHPSHLEHMKQSLEQMIHTFPFLLYSHIAVDIYGILYIDGMPVTFHRPTQQNLHLPLLLSGRPLHLTRLPQLPCIIGHCTAFFVHCASTLLDAGVDLSVVDGNNGSILYYLLQYHGNYHLLILILHQLQSISMELALPKSGSRLDLLTTHSVGASIDVYALEDDRGFIPDSDSEDFTLTDTDSDELDGDAQDNEHVLSHTTRKRNFFSRKGIIVPGIFEHSSGRYHSCSLIDIALFMIPHGHLQVIRRIAQGSLDPVSQTPQFQSTMSKIRREVAEKFIFIFNMLELGCSPTLASVDCQDILSFREACLGASPPLSLRLFNPSKPLYDTPKKRSQTNESLFTVLQSQHSCDMTMSQSTRSQFQSSQGSIANPFVQHEQLTSTQIVPNDFCRSPPFLQARSEATFEFSQPTSMNPETRHEMQHHYHVDENTFPVVSGHIISPSHGTIDLTCYASTCACCVHAQPPGPSSPSQSSIPGSPSHLSSSQVRSPFLDSSPVGLNAVESPSEDIFHSCNTALFYYYPIPPSGLDLLLSTLSTPSRLSTTTAIGVPAITQSLPPIYAPGRVTHHTMLSFTQLSHLFTHCKCDILNEIATHDDPTKASRLGNARQLVSEFQRINYHASRDIHGYRNSGRMTLFSQAKQYALLNRLTAATYPDIHHHMCLTQYLLRRPSSSKSTIEALKTIAHRLAVGGDTTAHTQTALHFANTIVNALERQADEYRLISESSGNISIAGTPWNTQQCLDHFLWQVVDQISSTYRDQSICLIPSLSNAQGPAKERFLSNPRLILHWVLDSIQHDVSHTPSFDDILNIRTALLKILPSTQDDAMSTFQCNSKSHLARRIHDILNTYVQRLVTNETTGSVSDSHSPELLLCLRHIGGLLMHGASPLSIGPRSQQVPTQKYALSSTPAGGISISPTNNLQWLDYYYALSHGLVWPTIYLHRVLPVLQTTCSHSSNLQLDTPSQPVSSPSTVTPINTAPTRLAIPSHSRLAQLRARHSEKTQLKSMSQEHLLNTRPVNASEQECIESSCFQYQSHFQPAHFYACSTSLPYELFNLLLSHAQIVFQYGTYPLAPAIAYQYETLSVSTPAPHPQSHTTPLFSQYLSLPLSHLHSSIIQPQSILQTDTERMVIASPDAMMPTQHAQGYSPAMIKKAIQTLHTPYSSFLLSICVLNRLPLHTLHLLVCGLNGFIQLPRDHAIDESRLHPSLLSYCISHCSDPMVLAALFLGLLCQIPNGDDDGDMNGEHPFAQALVPLLLGIVQKIHNPKHLS